MSVHSVYMHVNFTQYSQLVHVLLTSAFDPLLWKTVCDCLYLLKPWHSTAKLLIRITRELCSPCSYQSPAPVVVNTSVPQSSPSANSTQDTPVLCNFDLSFCWRFQSEFLRCAQMRMHPAPHPHASITHTSQLFSHFYCELTWNMCQAQKSASSSRPVKGDHCSYPHRTGDNRAGERRIPMFEWM